MKKSIEHIKGLALCEHWATEWDVALANTLVCLKVGASRADEQAIIKGMKQGDAIWHGGHLLTGRVS